MMCKHSVAVALLLGTVLVMTCAVASFAGTVYVKWDSPNEGPGNDWDHAYHTVTAGLSAAVSGDEVWVAGDSAHPYVERITLTDGVGLYGGFAGTETSRGQRDRRANVTVLDGNQGGSVVTSPSGATATTIIDGFTIRNGSAVDGGGIYCASSSPTITNNTITGNSANSGGGIYCYSSSPVISNNTITGNGASGGGGIYCYSSSPTIANNTITGNSAIWDGGGIYCYSSSPVIANNTISGNGGTFGGGIFCCSSSPVISNNTITANSAVTGGGIYCGSWPPTISNNIVAFNSSGVFSDGATPTLANNCVYNPGGYNYFGVPDPTGTNGNISADPKLVSAQYGKTHIQPDSPCSDAGEDSVVQPGWLDMDGQARIQGAHVDIGADESDGTIWTFTPVVVRVSPAGNDSNDGSTWALAKRTVQAGLNAASANGGEVWVEAGTYSERIVLLAYAYLYGGFAGTESFRSERNWTAHVAVIDGGRMGGVVRAQTGHSVTLSGIDGFTIRNGFAICGGGIFCSSSSPTIANNTITGNSAEAGGGIGCWWDSSPTITNNTISGNWPCGIDCKSSSPTITHNTISGNWTYGIICYLSAPSITNNTISGNSGAGIYCDSSDLTISNNTISGNSFGILSWNACSPSITNNMISGNSTGIYCAHNNGSPTITNNTITANTGEGIYCYQTLPTITNNIVAFNSSGVSIESAVTLTVANNCVYNPGGANYDGLSAGVGDISLDPMLDDPVRGDCHLLPGSPCIDAGWNNAPGLTMVDMDGQPRLMGPAVDIGADEFPYSAFGVYRISPTRYGRVGPVTLMIGGSRFRAGATAKLARAAGPELIPESVTLVNEWQLNARFNLLGAALGRYDVVVTNPDLRSATLPNAFEVTVGIGSKLAAQLNVPPQVRSGRDYVALIEYGNDGDEDMPAPVFIVSSPTHTPMRLTQEEAFHTNPIQVLGISYTGDAGVLRPGQHYRIPVYFHALAGENRFNLDTMTGDSPPIDWAAVEQQIRPPSADPAVWDPMFSQLKTQIGNLWGGYANALRTNATRLGNRGKRVYDCRELFGMEVEKAYDNASGAIVGFVRLAGSEWQVAGAQVAAYDAAGKLAAVATSESSGYFAVQFIPQGTYDLKVAGYIPDQPVQVNVTEAQDTLGVVLSVHAGGKIAGAVSAQGGGPISGVLIATEDEHGDAFVATSDETGAYQVIGLPTGVYTVRCSHQDYVSAERTGVSVTLGSTTSGISFELQRGGTIAGTVTAAGGGALADVAVSLEQGGIASSGTVTAADGTYTIQGLPPGSYSVRFLKDHYWSVTRQVTVAAPGTTNLDVALDAAGRISGSINGFCGWSPLPRFAVSVYNDGLAYPLITGGYPQLFTTTSADNGAFLIDNLPPGECMVRVGPWGAPSGWAPVGIDPVPVIAPPFTLPAVGSISGRTLESDGTTAVARAAVHLFHDGKEIASVTTAHDGTYSFLLLHAGSYELRATESTHGFLPHTDLDVSGCAVLTGVNFVAGGATISGVVRDADSGSPVPEAVVGIDFVLPGGETQRVATLQTDVNGSFAFEGAQPGAYWVRAAASGLSWSSVSVNVQSGQSQVTTALDLQPGASVTGIVRDGSDAAVAHSWIMLYDTNDASFYRVTISEDDGSYAIDALPPGTFELRAEDSAKGFQSVEVSLQAGQSLTQDVSLSAGTSSISGTVSDDSGQPLPDAQITLLAEDGKAQCVVDSRADGTYAISGIGQGSFSLKAILPGHLPGELLSVTVGNGAPVTDADLTLISAAVGIGAAYPEYETSHSANSTAQQNRILAAALLRARLASSESTGCDADACNQAKDRYVAASETYERAVELFSAKQSYYWATSGLVVSQMVIGVGVAGLGGAAVTAVTEGLALGTGGSIVVEAAGSYLSGLVTRLLQGQPFAPSDIESVNSSLYDKIVSLEAESLYCQSHIRIGWSPTEAIKDANDFYKRIENAQAKIGMVVACLDVIKDKGNEWWNAAEDMVRAENVADEAERNLESAKHRVWGVCGGCGTSLPDPPDTLIDSKPSQGIYPIDPNEKKGPLGMGPDQLVTADGELTYVVYFENHASASAPVQEAVIWDYLDEDLDWSTFQVGEIAFGSTEITAVAGMDSGTVRIPLAGTSYVVDVEVDLNRYTGKARWSFRTIDPATGEFPTDPMAGFLPPNDPATHCGEGHVTFTIKPKPGVAGGTRITNKATIFFDTEAGITTNEWANTVSASGLPGVKATANGLPAFCPSATVTAVFGDAFYFYVESADRSCGIRVQKAGHGLTVGQTVDVAGMVQTNEDGERYLDASSLTAAGFAPVGPLMMVNRCIGGSDWNYEPATGAGQKGISGSAGLNNIGLLVTTWGRVTEVDSASPAAWFRIDDGSGFNVKCVVPSNVEIDLGWQFVGVIGISSCENIGGDLHRLLRVRMQDDIIPY